MNKLNLRHFGSKSSKRNTTTSVSAEGNYGAGPEVKRIVTTDIALPLSEKSTFSKSLPPLKKDPPKTKATPTIQRCPRGLIDPRRFHFFFFFF